MSRQEYDELKALVGELTVKSKKYDELEKLVGKLQAELVNVQEDNAKLHDRIK